MWKNLGQGNLPPNQKQNKLRNITFSKRINKLNRFQNNTHHHLQNNTHTHVKYVNGIAIFSA